jgi:hypothetical protein
VNPELGNGGGAEAAIKQQLMLEVLPIVPDLHHVAAAEGLKKGGLGCAQAARCVKLIDDVGGLQTATWLHQHRQGVLP